MRWTEPHKVEIENEDLFELKAWLDEMREQKNSNAMYDSRHNEGVRSLERRLAIFERIMKQLP